MHPDDFDLVQGLPVGVQITCGKYGEERCIAVGKVIMDLLNEADAKDISTADS